MNRILGPLLVLHVAVLVALSTAAAAQPAAQPAAQHLTEDAIFQMLVGKPRQGTRGFERPDDPDKLRRLLDQHDRLQTRSFTAKERFTDATAQQAAEELRREIAAETSDRPQIDLEVYFPFNSSALSPASIELLGKLGRALQMPQLQGRGILIAGHTDAKGRAAANLAVSRARAERVRRYLIEKFGLNHGLIRTIGYGKEQPKVLSDPFAAINRRVQIINLPDGTLADRR